MKRFYTFFAVLSIFVCVIAPAVGNEADWMPDANLRAAVRSALNLNNNDTLTQAGMANLTSLTARNAQISDLTGLEHATNLTSLDLRDNTISDISALSGLTNLESLKLKGNGISSVSDLSGLSSLTLLNLKENNISSISDLSGLTNLEHLRVDENSITDVQPLTSLVNLEKLWIAGNSLTNAHLLSSLTGLTQIDIPIPDPPDTTAPSVSISVPSDTQNGAFDATITFSEAVSDFLQEDLSLSGTASATLTNWSANTENTIYTATITPTTSGTVILDVTVDVAIDVAGNNNTAADPQTVTITLPDSDPPDAPDVDTTPPGISFSADLETLFVRPLHYTANSEFDMTITFTEPVSGFELSDIEIWGWAEGSVTALTKVDDETYIATVNPVIPNGVSRMKLHIPPGVLTDVAGNPNARTYSPDITIEQLRPDVAITVPDADVETETFTITITFEGGGRDDRPLGFDQSDVSLTNNTAGATITKWTELQRGFISNGVSFQGTYGVFEAEITVTQSGTITFGVSENVATDLAGNGNTVAVQKTVTITLPGSDPPEVPDVDTTPPGISFSADLETLYIRGLYYTTNGPFDMTMTFTEPVSGFELSDIEIWGWAEGSVTALTKVDDETYIATVNPVIPNGVSRMKLHIPPGVLTDVAGNPNARTYSPDITIEQLRPDVAITVPDADVETETFTITITFDGGERDDRPLGFDQSDVSLTNNTAGATITKWTELQRGFISNGVSFQGAYGVFEAEITATQSGSVTFGVPENVATDLAGNTNTAATQKTVNIEIYLPWDVNEDGSVNAADITLVTLALGQSGENIENSRTDVNNDGTVDNADLLLVAGHLDANNAAPMSRRLFTLMDRETLETLDIVTLEVQLAILRRQSDGSPKYLLAITLLESLLEAMRPDETQLLANYPNPFNPETWIPYHLAKSSDVRITIYDVRGSVVRRLELGHLPPGYYTSRSRAAYWDGRNDFGERVATGIYFYQLRADNMSLLRKMVILK